MVVFDLREEEDLEDNDFVKEEVATTAAARLEVFTLNAIELISLGGGVETL